MAVGFVVLAVKLSPSFACFCCGICHLFTLPDEDRDKELRVFGLEFVVY